MYPCYRIPKRLILGLVRDAILLRPRRFKSDAEACVAGLAPPLCVLGAEYIPQGGPCLVTFNHYHRPGFDAWWLALAITAALAVDPHWVITSELTFPGSWFAPLGRPLSRLILDGGSRVYGFTTMPPMPPRPRDVEARARAVRAVLAYVKRSVRPVVCLAPEGGDMPGGRLSWPPSGAGRFIVLLAGCGLSVVPLGAWEEEGALCLRFGPAYELSVLSRFSSGEKDREAARIVMGNIARLLPTHLRGDFR
jgi:hypothetical protein